MTIKRAIRPRNAENAAAREGRSDGRGDALRIYLNEVRRLPRLSEEAEALAAKQMEGGRRRAVRALARARELGVAAALFGEVNAPAVESLLRSPKAGPRLITLGARAKKVLARKGAEALRGEQRRLCRRLVRGVYDWEAGRGLLVAGSLRLVIWFAKRYAAPSPLPMLDLIQEGNIGLMRAAADFSWQRGRRFGRFAAPAIRWSILRALATQGRTVHVPQELMGKARRIDSLRRELAQEMGREPEDAEVARRAGVPTAEVRRLRALSIAGVSLDAPSAEDEERALSESIADLKAVSPLGEALKDGLRRRVRAAVESLPPRERDIVGAHFGLADGEARTLAAAGRGLSLTRERARQLNARALERLGRRLRDLSPHARAAAV